MDAHSPLAYDSDHYRLILETIPHLVWVAAPDGAIEYLNRQCLQFAGMPMGDLLGWDWGQLIHPEDLPQTLASWTNALQSGTPMVTECRMRRADGVFRWFVNRGQPVKDDSGRVVRWFGTCTDVEDRKKAEAAKRASDSLFRVIVERSYEGFALLANDYTIRYVSPAVTRLLGYLPETLLGENAGEFAHPDDRPGLCAWIEYLTSQPGERIEVWYRFRHRDGSYQRLEVRITNLLEDPDVHAFVLNFWDISDLRSVRPGSPSS